MNPLSVLCLVACLLAAASGSSHPSNPMRGNSLNDNMRPTDWLSVSQLESLPSVNEISLQQLETMSAEEGAELVNRIYHLSQINHNVAPSFVPTPSDIPVYIATPRGQRVNTDLKQLVSNLKQQPNFGNQEVTIFITGLPEQTPSITKANRALVQAYMQRYNGQQQQKQQNRDYDYGNTNQVRTSSEEDYNNISQNQQNQQNPTGNLIVIDLGATITNFNQFATLNVEKVAASFANVLVQMTNEIDVPQEIIHIVAQGIASHVAGAAARQYSRLTGHQLRRITALDPSVIIARNANTLTGLARGDAEFVDAIHTSAYGMGTPTRVGNADFYPNGPSVTVPGAKNIVEATMRATRYFAESVRPGNGHNFPAVAASTLQQYKNNNGYGSRGYMGISADFDLEGDYILQVNAKSPFGRSAPAQRQNAQTNGAHQPTRKNSMDY